MGHGKECHDRKVSKVINEFGKGSLKSSSGSKVTSRKQALAIALSEARESCGKRAAPAPKR